MSFVSVYVTAAHHAEALRISRALLRARLIACANILRHVDSLYWWKGRIERSREVALILKTRRAHLKALVRAVRAMHSYETPCIVAWQVPGGDARYLKWVEAETTVKPAQRRRLARSR